jgi:dTDP-4-dehydrorhamnose 3,5-epimerase
MITGVITKNLRVIADERGRLMEILRCDEPLFSAFGQVYMTTNYPGVVKAWHYHKKQTDNVCCVKGMIKLVVYDARKESPTYKETMEFFIGDHNPLLIAIPPGIYHGWKCISPEESLVVSVPTEPYNYKEPDEFRLPPDSPEIPYDWILDPGKKHG